MSKYSVIYCVASIPVGGSSVVTTAEIKDITTETQAKFIASQIEASFSSFGRCKAVVVKVA